MNSFVALCTIATLCFIRAIVLEDYDAEDLEMEMGRDLEEYDGEDHDLEMEMEMGRDLEEYDADDQDVELREVSRGSTTPFYSDRYCLEGWGGHCHFPAGMIDHSCDFIRNGSADGQPLCIDEEGYCCVNCYVQKQYDNCGNIAGLDSPTRRECCRGTWAVKTMNSGCKCCTTCKRKRNRCNKKDGRFCVKKNDPVCNNTYCQDICGGKLSYKGCSGKRCSCCIAGRNPENCG